LNFGGYLFLYFPEMIHLEAFNYHFVSSANNQKTILTGLGKHLKKRFLGFTKNHYLCGTIKSLYK